MNNKEKASISIFKIMAISIILVLISGIAVMASNTELKDIKIILQNGYELTALTAKTTVRQVLKENNIDIQENQKTIPEKIGYKRFDKELRKQSKYYWEHIL